MAANLAMTSQNEQTQNVGNAILYLFYHGGTICMSLEQIQDRLFSSSPVAPKIIRQSLTTWVDKGLLIRDGKYYKRRLRIAPRFTEQ